MKNIPSFNEWNALLEHEYYNTSSFIRKYDGDFQIKT